jgi:hypothetical protein
MRAVSRRGNHDYEMGIQHMPGCDDAVQYTEEQFGETPTHLVVLHILGDQGWEVCAQIDNGV